MKSLEMIDRIRKMDSLIDKKVTGTTRELAKKINLSVSRLYDILIDFKELGVPVRYSRKQRTYLYQKTGKFKIEIEWEE
jgi:hypothetical protein